MAYACTNAVNCLNVVSKVSNWTLYITSNILYLCGVLLQFALYVRSLLNELFNCLSPSPTPQQLTNMKHLFSYKKKSSFEMNHEVARYTSKWPRSVVIHMFGPVIQLVTWLGACWVVVGFHWSSGASYWCWMPARAFPNNITLVRETVLSLSAQSSRTQCQQSLGINSLCTTSK